MRCDDGVVAGKADRAEAEAEDEAVVKAMLPQVFGLVCAVLATEVG